MSSQTAWRTLVYFLVELKVVEYHTAAAFLVEARLKAAMIDELVQEMKEIDENLDE